MHIGDNEHQICELTFVIEYANKLALSITEIKLTVVGINSRLGDTEECISDLGDRIMEITQSKQQKEK